MNPMNALRVAIAVYLVAVLLFYATLFVPRELPVEAIPYAQWRAIQPLGPVVQGLTRVSIIAMFVSLASAIGLLFKLAAARFIFAVCILLMLFAELFLGFPALISGPQSFLNTLASVSAGSIIALSYFSVK